MVCHHRVLSFLRIIFVPLLFSDLAFVMTTKNFLKSYMYAATAVVLHTFA